MMFRGYTIFASTDITDVGWQLVDVKVVELISDVAMDVKLRPSCRCPADTGNVAGLVN